MFEDKASEEIDEIKKSNKVKSKVINSKEKKHAKDKTFKRRGFKSFLGKRFGKGQPPDVSRDGKAKRGWGYFRGKGDQPRYYRKKVSKK